MPPPTTARAEGIVYAPRALTARACFLSYVHPVHYNVVTDVVRGDGDPQSPVL